MSGRAADETSGSDPRLEVMSCGTERVGPGMEPPGARPAQPSGAGAADVRPWASGGGSPTARRTPEALLGGGSRPADNRRDDGRGPHPAGIRATGGEAPGSFSPPGTRSWEGPIHAPTAGACPMATAPRDGTPFPRGAGGPPTGDAIDQEAPATRARSSRRARVAAGPEEPGAAIAPPGGAHAAIAALPVTALRIDPETAARLARLGLRRVGDLVAMPRAALARRFGLPLVRRLDQALGSEPEPISPAPAPARLAVRLTFPDPIGREEDVLAALDRLLPALSERLRERGLAARRVRLEALRSEGDARSVEVGLARPSADPERIRPLLAMRTGEIEAGFGIDALRVEVVAAEPSPEAGPALAGLRAEARAPDEGAGPPAGRPAARGGPRHGAPDAGRAARAGAARDEAFADLVGRIGARLGLEAIRRVHPGDSHIPEKAHRTVFVAWSEPCSGWPAPAVAAARPLLMWPPEIVSDGASPDGASPSTSPPAARGGPGSGAGMAPPARFRWRGRTLEARAVSEPERIAPEWWLDEPEWRSGVRDYWRVTTAEGESLWLFYAHGARTSPGWFCQGAFA